jgi:hypothetical protein
MTINGHLVLLVVVSGLFVRLWNANERQKPAVAGRQADRIHVTSSPAKRGLPAQSQPVRPVSLPEGEAPREEIWTATSCPIALPAGIQPGDYRVVSATGQVARLEINSTLASRQSGDVASPEMQSITVRGVRWYFIRLQSTVAAGVKPDASQHAVRGDSQEPVAELPVREASARRKYDFSGFEPAAQETIVPAPEFRPDAPALPTAD